MYIIPDGLVNRIVLTGFTAKQFIGILIMYVTLMYDSLYSVYTDYDFGLIRTGEACNSVYEYTYKHKMVELHTRLWKKTDDGILK